MLFAKNQEPLSEILFSVIRHRATHVVKVSINLKGQNFNTHTDKSKTVCLF